MTNQNDETHTGQAHLSYDIETQKLIVAKEKSG